MNYLIYSDYLHHNLLYDVWGMTATSVLIEA